MQRFWLLGACAFLLSGCAALENDAERGVDVHPATSRWSYSWVTDGQPRWIKSGGRWGFTTADVRLITQRMHPVLGNEIICAEPGPDVAKAVSTSAGLQAQGGSGSASAQIAVAASSAEAAMELAGRSTALLALRDGLFRACEAYGNGVLGQDAYALIISRYSTLMSTLFLAQDMTGVVGAEGKAIAQSAALGVLGGTPTTGGANPGASGGKGNGNSSDPGASTSAKTSTSTAPTAPQLIGATWSLPARIDDRFLIQAKTAAAADPPVAAPAAKPGEEAPATPVPDATKTATVDANTPAGSNSTGAGTVASLALTRMNEDYMNLGVLDVLLTSCINEGDPTRLARRFGNTAGEPLADAGAGAVQPQQTATPKTGNVDYNPFLKTACDAMFKGLPTGAREAKQAGAQPAAGAAAIGAPSNSGLSNLFGMLLAVHADAIKATPLVDPVKGVGANPNSTPKPQAPAGDGDTIKKVQVALSTLARQLKNSALDPKTTSGQVDYQTASAVRSYQLGFIAEYKSKTKIANGNPLDADTIAQLLATPTPPS